MLILTRKEKEGIVIGDNIEVSVISIDGNKVKIGITAPKDISIVRSELFEAVKEENKSAGKITVTDIDFSIFKNYTEGRKEEK